MRHARAPVASRSLAMMLFDVRFLPHVALDFESEGGIVAVSAQEGSEAWRLITEIHDTYWLVNIVDNDYVNGHGLEVFDRVMNRQAQCSESD